MSPKKITVSGTGCALADFLYNGISFLGPYFKKYQSVKNGDGGLSPGKLVFTEELEKYSGVPYPQILKEITGDHQPDAFNVGGPSLVSLVHASQMLYNHNNSIRFFGMAGKDEVAGKIFEIVRKTPLNIMNYLSSGRKATPFTDVFSDAGYAEGNGERTFVNNIGAAWDYSPDHIDTSFFDSGIVCFGGTALVPQIHDNLTRLLSKAKNKGCLTLVNTVFDFRNEKKNPGFVWPLVDDPGDFQFVDLLVMDREEALKISGQQSIDQAADFFSSMKLSCFIITDGANELYAKSRGGLFEKTGLVKLPVSEKVKSDLKDIQELRGDTTGCGDNFAGGIIFSLVLQLKNKQPGHLDLIEALTWGIASGGFACFTVGGTYIEKHRGEKLERITSLQKEYLKQINW